MVAKTAPTCIFRSVNTPTRLLAASSADLTPAKRARFVAAAAVAPFDAVILTHRALEMLPLRQESREAYVNSEMAQLRAALAALGERAPSRKRVEKPVASREAKLQKLLDK